GVSQPLADIPEKGRLVPRTPANDDAHLVHGRRPSHDDSRSGERHQLRMSRGEALDPLIHHRERVVDELLHATTSVGGSIELRASLIAPRNARADSVMLPSSPAATAPLPTRFRDTAMATAPARMKSPALSRSIPPVATSFTS